MNSGLAGLLNEDDLADGTVGGLLAARALAYPGKPAIVCGDRELTYRQLDLAASTVARGLAATGAEPGDCVGILLPNRIEYILAWLGAARAGLVEVPVNSAYKGPFLDHALRSTDVRILITEPGLLGLVGALPELPGTLETIVLLDTATTATPDAPAGVKVQAWDSLLTAGERSTAPLPAVRPDTPAAIMLTSGTTGRSKGVVQPHLMQIVGGRENAAHLGTTAEDRLYTCLPLFHGAAQINMTLHSIWAGATLVLGRRFSASRFWDEVRAHRVTMFNAIGSILPMLLAQPPSADDRDNRVSTVFAVPAPAPVLHPFEERFGVRIIEGYGLTEIKNVSYNPLGARKVGSIGLPTKSSILEIHGESGERLGPRQAGEIVYRPRLPYIMFSGYHRDPGATLETMRDLWWHTGDLGCTDDDGYFYFIDRKKDALRRRGENISSHEVESVLLAYPGVTAAAAVGTPSDLGEDEILAVVQLAPGQAADFADLFRHCDRSMPHFMVPRYYRAVDEIPATATGKVRKGDLRGDGRSGAWDSLAAGFRPTRHG